MNSEFFEAVKLLEKEKGIPAEYLYEKISNAIVVSLKRDYGGKDVVFCDISPEKSTMNVYIRKKVVDTVTDPDTEISVIDARQYDASAVDGGVVEIKLETKQFGRIAAQTAKHVIRQGIREAERGQVMQEFMSRHHELVTATVQRIDPRTGNATLEIGRAEAMLPKSEQLPNETLKEGDLIKVYVVDVKEGDKDPRAMISRTHPGLVKRLFEMEVPEIYDGIVEIKSISREAGSRTKMAVYSQDPNVDAVGACIGSRGARVSKVVDVLGGEKIDIVKYSDEPSAFISAALAPADVVRVDVDPSGAKSCLALVPDSQISLAIGNKGQNARLAAKLTGWKIDIRPESSAPSLKKLSDDDELEDDLYLDDEPELYDDSNAKEDELVLDGDNEDIEISVSKEENE